MSLDREASKAVAVIAVKLPDSLRSKAGRTSKVIGYREKLVGFPESVARIEMLYIPIFGTSTPANETIPELLIVSHVGALDRDQFIVPEAPVAPDIVANWPLEPAVTAAILATLLLSVYTRFCTELKFRVNVIAIVVPTTIDAISFYMLFN
jgi:hypothetical protein